MTGVREFIETGSYVAAIQHDGSEETALQIKEFVKSPLSAELLPRGSWNNDETNIYLTLQSLYSVVYISPGDWVVEKDGTVSVVHNKEFANGYLEVTKPMGNLIDHARRELELSGEEPDTIDWYLEVVQAFASFGHSGGSAAFTIPVINKLLQYQNLTPLTDNPEDWTFYGEDIAGRKGGMWQSNRNPQAFSFDAGKTYYLLTEGGTKKKIFHKSEKM